MITRNRKTKEQLLSEISELKNQILELETEVKSLRNRNEHPYHKVNKPNEPGSNKELLEESERRLKRLMSNLPGMAYRCLNDDNWTMEFVSEG
ncbi:MAG: hypothetical protein MI922_02125, partial [Bacteroidales bacterium]|nr:hypothetical protein [Bacteroidales bacterium]